MTCQVMVGRQARRYGRSVTTTMNGTVRPVGPLLRDWRQRRRLSQLELASQAEVSARHLSFVENGRARPSREMVLHLCEQLDVPLRERNALLVAAGFAPVYRQTDLDAPEMESVRLAIDQVLKGHEPYPAVVVDRRWNLVAGNDAVAIFVNDVDPGLLEPPMNVLRLTMHPRGLATRIVNFAEYRHHLLTRLRREAMITGDDGLAALYEELVAYPAPDDDVGFDAAPPVVMPLRLRTNDGDFSFFSTIATFGTAGRHHPRGAVDRSVLPGRRDDRALPTLDPAQSLTRRPRLDDQMVTAGLDRHHVGDVDLEEVQRIVVRWSVTVRLAEGGEERELRRRVDDLDGASGHPHVAFGDLLVDRGVVQGHTRVALEIAGLDRIVHHPQPQLAVGEARLDTADTG